MSQYIGQTPGQGQIQYFTFVANAGQTSFSGVDSKGYVLNYSVGFCDVFLNGRRLTPTSDYTATDGSTIVLQSATSVNDILFVASASAFNTANWVTNSVNYVYVATAGQTSFTGLDSNNQTLSYVNGTIIVSVNGLHLPQSDYTATDGTSIVLNSGVNSGDIVQIFSLRTMNPVNIFTQTQSDARYLQLTGGTLTTNNLTVGTSSYFVSNGNVGIGSTTPQQKLEVVGLINSCDAAGNSRTYMGWKSGSAYAGNNGLHLINIDNSNLLLGTNNQTQALITTVGNFGIGNTAPAHRLSVNGNTYFGNSVSFSDGSQFNSASSLGMRNRIINGDFRIWQRGTSFANPTSAANQYGADRWCFVRPSYAGNTTMSQVTGLTINGNNRTAMRLQRTSGDISTGLIQTCQAIESLNIRDLAGQTITISGYYRTGANFSNTSLSIQFVTGTGTDETNPITNGYTGGTVAISTSVAANTNFTKFSVTGTLASNINEAGLTFIYGPSGTAGAADYFDLIDIQVEAGSVATPFERRHYTQELALCQRYYFTNPSQSYVINGVGATYTPYFFKVSMRVAPTVTLSASATLTNIDTHGFYAQPGTAASTTVTASAEL